MSIYAISDLHLSFHTNKPMNVFGSIWDHYEERVKENWIKKVKNQDLVLLPGDFSWETHMKDTFLDFQFIEQLPGKKLLLKGNHDYWWSTLAKMRAYVGEHFHDIDFLYNNSYFFENHIIAGTRGWSHPVSEEDKKIVEREKIRLKLSLEDGIQKYGNQFPIIVCMHYPPEPEFLEIMKQYPVEKCIYGHLHGSAHKNVKEGIIDGIEWIMVSCDYTNFDLIPIVP